MRLRDALGDASVSDILHSLHELPAPKKSVVHHKKVVDNSSVVHIHCVSYQQRPARHDAARASQPARALGADHMATLTRKNILKSGAGVYAIPGVMGTVTIGKQMLAEGASFPETLVIDGLSVKEAKAKAPKMTPEERKAANAAKTPEQKLSEQEKRIATQSANLAARKAKLAASA